MKMASIMQVKFPAWPWIWSAFAMRLKFHTSLLLSWRYELAYTQVSNNNSINLLYNKVIDACWIYCWNHGDSLVYVYIHYVDYIQTGHILLKVTSINIIILCTTPWSVSPAWTRSGLLSKSKLAFTYLFALPRWLGWVYSILLVLLKLFPVAVSIILMFLSRMQIREEKYLPCNCPVTQSCIMMTRSKSCRKRFWLTLTSDLRRLQRCWDFDAHQCLRCTQTCYQD